jgi:hypothetical protein
MKMTDFCFAVFKDPPLKCSFASRLSMSFTLTLQTLPMRVEPSVLYHEEFVLNKGQRVTGVVATAAFRCWSLALHSTYFTVFAPLRITSGHDLWLLQRFRIYFLKRFERLAPAFFSFRALVGQE